MLERIHSVIHYEKSLGRIRIKIAVIPSLTSEHRPVQVLRLERKKKFLLGAIKRDSSGCKALVERIFDGKVMELKSSKGEKSPHVKLE